MPLKKLFLVRHCLIMNFVWFLIYFHCWQPHSSVFFCSHISLKNQKSLWFSRSSRITYSLWLIDHRFQWLQTLQKLSALLENIIYQCSCHRVKHAPCLNQTIVLEPGGPLTENRIASFHLVLHLRPIGPIRLK